MGQNQRPEHHLCVSITQVAGAQALGAPLALFQGALTEDWIGSGTAKELSRDARVTGSSFSYCTPMATPTLKS